VEPGLQFSGLVGQVRVHDGVLSDAQVLQNFNAEKANYHYDASSTYLRRRRPNFQRRQSIDTLSTTLPPQVMAPSSPTLSGLGLIKPMVSSGERELQ
jgi:hypothetical protein